MILAIIFLVLAQFILIPIVFSVQKTNTRVISLFALVPVDEIKLLAECCEKYMEDFVDNEENGNIKTQQKKIE
jgi:hypothetical protein